MIRSWLMIALFAPSAHAGATDGLARFRAACLPAAGIADEIESCTDNARAQQRADSCRSALLAAWSAANGELEKVMSLGKKNLDTKQQADFLHSHQDMQLAIDKLNQLVSRTEQAADMLAEYPRVMFDNPYAEPGLVGSSKCYVGPFKGIEKLVQDLDQKAEEGRDALEAVDQLRGISQARDDQIRGSFSGRATGLGAARVPAGTTPVVASDVTGVKKEAAAKRSPRPAGAVSGFLPPSSSVTERQGDLPGSFSGRNSLLPAGPESAGASPKDGRSVADSLFSAPDAEVSHLRLVVDGMESPAPSSATAAAREPSGADGAAAGASSPSGDAPLTAADAASPPAEPPASLTAGVSDDADLFGRVRDRYRATTLFREAR
jgi:hypothetical protein